MLWIYVDVATFGIKVYGWNNYYSYVFSHLKRRICPMHRKSKLSVHIFMLDNDPLHASFYKGVFVK